MWGDAPESSHKDHEKFNAAQRAHQNTLENWAPVQILMLVNGLFFPSQAAPSPLPGGMLLGKINFGKKPSEISGQFFLPGF